MALDFPSSPTNGQVFGAYTWDSARGVWLQTSMSSRVVTTSDTAPSSPTNGDMWMYTVDGTCFIYYDDGTSGQWVEQSKSVFTPATYQSPNHIINGGFDIWQRGTSFSSPAGTAYVADRWYGGSVAGTYTVSRQTTGSPPTSEYYIRTAHSGAGSNYHNKMQIIETLNVVPLLGKVVTLQVKLRRNASFAGGITVGLFKSSTVDAVQASTWTQIGSTAISNALLPTGTTSVDWYTATLTLTVPNDGTANSLRVTVYETAVQASGSSWDMAEVQLEAGSVATPFRRSGSNIQAELAACQRYYYRATPGSGNNASFAPGLVNTATQALVHVPFPVVMRVDPTLETSGTAANYRVYSSAANVACNTVPVISTGSSSPVSVTLVATVASGLAAGQACLLMSNNSSAAYLGFSAEL